MSIGLVAIALELGVFAAHYLWNSDSLRDAEAGNRALEAEIEPLKTKPGELQKLQEEMKQSAGRVASLQAVLQMRRLGPLHRLLEVSKILTPGVGPTLREGAAATFNPGWNSDNVWLSLYQETGATIRIEGRAAGLSDLTEFTNRLDQSKEFGSPEPLKGTQEGNELSFAVQVRASR